MTLGVPPYKKEDCIQIVEGYINSARTKAEFSMFTYGYGRGLIGAWHLAGLLTQDEADELGRRLAVAFEENEERGNG